jgi:hypothetical protein
VIQATNLYFVFIGIVLTSYIQGSTMRCWEVWNVLAVLLLVYLGYALAIVRQYQDVRGFWSNARRVDKGVSGEVYFPWGLARRWSCPMDDTPLEEDGAPEGPPGGGQTWLGRASRRLWGRIDAAGYFWGAVGLLGGTLLVNAVLIGGIVVRVC